MSKLRTVATRRARTMKMRKARRMATLAKAESELPSKAM